MPNFIYVSPEPCAFWIFYYRIEACALGLVVRAGFILEVAVRNALDERLRVGAGLVERRDETERFDHQLMNEIGERLARSLLGNYRSENVIGVRVVIALAHRQLISGVWIGSICQFLEG